MTEPQYVYTVTEFGCNSGHNDMYPPTVTLFKSRTDAYEYYNEIKKSLYSNDPDYPIKVHEYTYATGESVIQDSEDVKRPQGVSITCVPIRESTETK